MIHLYVSLNKKLFFKIALILLISLSILISSNLPSYAQSSATFGVAQIVAIKDKKVKDGSIISSAAKGNILTAVPYDAQVMGVVARDAAIILNTKNIENGVPVVSTGTVYVLVSSQAGKIKKGDMLASSTIPGVAVKAVKEGYVLGSALEDYDNPNTKQVGEIAIDLNLHYFNSKPIFPGSLSDVFKIAVLPTKDSPSPIFKYIIAAAVVLGSFILAFLSFGRTAAKGVEALGRNPAASKIIHLGIIFNVMIVGLIVFVGLVVAFLILRL